MDHKEEHPDVLKDMKGAEVEPGNDPRFAQAPPANHAMPLLILAAIGVVVLIGIYLTASGVFDNAPESGEATLPQSEAPMANETAKAVPDSASGDDTQAEPKEKSQ